MEIGKEIKRRREKMGMTPEELAGKTGIECRCIMRLENGITQNPNIDTIEKLSIALRWNLFAYLAIEIVPALLNEP